MRRIRYHEHGGPEVLRLEEAEVPEPGPGELLVRVEAVGVTLPAVRKVREGGGPLPGVLGGEVAGEVLAAGPEAAGFAVGDRVTGLSFTGSYAEVATVPAALASAIPEGASATRAAALVRSGLVALGAHRAARPEPGESVLVTAAASGVGHLAVQLAKARGAGRVVAAVGSGAKADFVRGLGADEVVTYDEENWGEPVDVVLDAVGGGLLPRAVAALAPYGRLVAYSSGGGSVDAYDLLTGSRSVIGFQMAGLARTRPDLVDAWREELWAMAEDGRLRPAVHAELPLAEAARAHEIIEARANLGKVVLYP